MTYKLHPDAEKKLQEKAKEVGAPVKALLDVLIDIASDETADTLREAIAKVKEWEGNIARARKVIRDQEEAYNLAREAFIKAKAATLAYQEETARKSVAPPK
jgi:hypothetical protein